MFKLLNTLTGVMRKVSLRFRYNNSEVQGRLHRYVDLHLYNHATKHVNVHAHEGCDCASLHQGFNTSMLYDCTMQPEVCTHVKLNFWSGSLLLLTFGTDSDYPVIIGVVAQRWQAVAARWQRGGRGGGGNEACLQCCRGGADVAMPTVVIHP